MSHEKSTFQKTEVKNWDDIVTRREALLKLAVTSMLAASLQPILALARQPEEGLKQYSGKRIITEIQTVELWKDIDATVLYTQLSVIADGEYSISAYVVRDAPTMIILPGLVISRAIKQNKIDIVALGSDDEYVHITDTSSLGDEECIDKALLEAQKRGLRKTVRYLQIIKDKYNKYKKVKQ